MKLNKDKQEEGQKEKRYNEFSAVKQVVMAEARRLYLY